MAPVTANGNKFTVKAYSGDNKTLLAFNFIDDNLAKNLAGFTIACKLPGAEPAFYLFNFLAFQNPKAHVQVSGELPHSTVNAPIQKYRWIDFAHAPAAGAALVVGNYVYTVTPRYFDVTGGMLAIDNTKSVSVTIPVGPFISGALTLGFTRGYMQSQAYGRHFGGNTPVQPANRSLQFATSSNAGTDNNGQTVTFAQIYDWMGETARVEIFKLLNEVLNDASLQLDVFAYDLNEPDIVSAFLTLAGEGRIRIILDSAQLHVTHTVKNKKTGATTTVVPLEDDFAKAFSQRAKGTAAIKRGCFARFSHNKVFIVSRNGLATKVLTGSTNFSVTGLYVNANHVLVFGASTIAQYYAKVFAQSWTVLNSPNPSKTIAAAFAATPLAAQPFTNSEPTSPKMFIHVSPHTPADTSAILTAIENRIKAEASAPNGNVLFAVMQLTGSQSPVYQTLAAVNSTQTLFSYGISDSPGGIKLYAPGTKTGVLVTGKPSQVLLPPPFNRVPAPPGHEIHDKFVICGVNGSDPVVWCGSSNLATGGEESNGDNLLEIHDSDVAMSFAIEGLLLVDHYNFLDRYATPPKAKAQAAPVGSKSAAKKTLSTGALSGGANVNKTSAKRTAAKQVPLTKRTESKKGTTSKPMIRSAAKKSVRKRSGIKTASLRVPTTTVHMMAPAKKKNIGKNPVKTTATKKNADNNAAKPAAPSSVVTQIPQSLEKAATQAGIYLYTNDTWSLRYFDPNDLHSLERTLFG